MHADSCGGPTHDVELSVASVMHVAAHVEPAAGRMVNPTARALQHPGVFSPEAVHGKRALEEVVTTVASRRPGLGSTKALLEAVLAKKAAQPDVDAPHPALVSGPRWTPETQAALSRAVAERLGYSFAHGRLDVSTHPFTGGAGPFGFGGDREKPAT